MAEQPATKKCKECGRPSKSVVKDVCFSCDLKAGETRRLRDEFAAAALTGMIAHPSGAETSEECAESAYKIADAMLGEREKGGKK